MCNYLQINPIDKTIRNRVDTLLCLLDNLYYSIGLYVRIKIEMLGILLDGLIK